MKTSARNAAWVTLIGCVVAVSCAGKNLNDVGDVNDPTGSGGEDTSTGGKNDPLGSAGEDNSSTGNTGGKSGGKAGSNTGGKAGGNVGGKAGGAVGGEAGHPEIDDGEGGVGGAAEDHGFVCETCELVAETPGLRSVWVEGDRLYWIEYGSFDELFNYLDNGRLMAVPLEGGEPEAVVSNLQGPRQLAMSEDYAYAVVDRSNSLSGTLQLVQITLDTGQVVELGAITPAHGYYHYGRDWGRRFFAAGGGYAFWFDDGTIFRLAEGVPGDPEAVMMAEDVVRLLADASKLYVQDNAGIGTMVFDGTALTPLWVSENASGYDPLVVKSDYFYAAAGGYISRLPLSGGAMKNISTLTGFWTGQLVIDGERLVGDPGVMLGNGRIYSALVEGTVTEADSARQLARAPQWSDEYSGYAPWRAWDATPTTVYLGYEDRLYRVARQP